MLSIYLLFALLISPSSPTDALERKVLETQQCDEKCGDFQIPFPFYINASCTVVSDSFRLSCTNSTALYLSIGSQKYQVFQFLKNGGVLVDFPGSSSCRQYYDLNQFGFAKNEFYAVSLENIVGLYDCEDSSLCKASCEGSATASSCDANNTVPVACCYPLSDRSVWHVGDDFSTFSQFGCRGMSCWNMVPGTSHGKRGVKLEWAIPSNSSYSACSGHASRINATAVESGTRCLCDAGFVGDGFAYGSGCLKSCTKGGQEAYGKDCDSKRGKKEILKILIGILAPLLVIATLIALYRLLKHSAKSGKPESDSARFHTVTAFQKTCRIRFFTYSELEDATKGFTESQKLIKERNDDDNRDDNTVYVGQLRDGSHVVVQKVQCDNERVLMDILSRLETLSTIVHVNMSTLIGCCIKNTFTPLVVYAYPQNGTLQTHLHCNNNSFKSQQNNSNLDWYKRLNIACETANVLSHLQHRISPPIFHNHLKTTSIFLNHVFSVQIALFQLFSTNQQTPTAQNNQSPYSFSSKNDVYDLGLLLIEIITGSGAKQVKIGPMFVLQMIRNGKVEEIVDHGLNYHEQPNFIQEQILRVAELAARCLLFGCEGKIGISDVEKELMNINGGISNSRRNKKDYVLEETFSNSSLLQMISMSPDSSFVHL